MFQEDSFALRIDCEAELQKSLPCTEALTAHPPPVSPTSALFSCANINLWHLPLSPGRRIPTQTAASKVSSMSPLHWQSPFPAVLECRDFEQSCQTWIAPAFWNVDNRPVSLAQLSLAVPKVPVLSALHQSRGKLFISAHLWLIPVTGTSVGKGVGLQLPWSPLAFEGRSTVR